MTQFVTFLIKIYQALRPFLLPRTCRYYPSCSSYAIEAFEKHGLIKGLFLSFMRIIRCTPFSKGGYDPVK